MMVSRKKFNDQAKRLKRKQFITGAEARDQLAREQGYTDFAAMEKALRVTGEWK
ncbi:hypothetical protein [Marinobacter phage PS6]|nr:hypothetical protein [Marinobacter phage PS6]